MDLSEKQLYDHMLIRSFSAEQIAINVKRMNMTLDDIMKMSRKTAGNLRKPRAYLNKRKNFSTTGAPQGIFSNVRSSRESKLSAKQNKSQKFPTVGALGNSSSFSSWKVSKPSVRQGLATERYLNLQNDQFHLKRSIATTVAPAPSRTRPLIRNRMQNLSNSRYLSYCTCQLVN
ncbi:hypothetical protein MKX01_026487 [Papaver californicum]|nr:hypothetical protein MKX01_026487 [Papaver californicum]